MKTQDIRKLMETLEQIKETNNYSPYDLINKLQWAYLNYGNDPVDIEKAGSSWIFTIKDQKFKITIQELINGEIPSEDDSSEDNSWNGVSSNWNTDEI